MAGSNFEIDPSANLKVDNTTNCIDWLTGGTGTGLRTTAALGDGSQATNDKPSGSTDDSFGQGTAEDNPNPTIVNGSIPPNKSDLKAFGIYTETGVPTISTPNQATDNPTGKFLELFWSRVQNPSGTTNMDFELNQKFCDPQGTAQDKLVNCANNGTSKNPLSVTPKRTVGDKLITYDLSKGGTVPTISIRTWTAAGVWSGATVISSGQNALALGSVNSSSTPIPANETGGGPTGTNPSGGLTTALGQQDPFTFGEASIAFSALFQGNTCGSFGSAYLKSRSSDSFNAEIKDFVHPEKVNITNCTGLVTDASNTPETEDEPAIIGSPISDSATLSGATSNATGTITFHLYSDAACENEIDTGLEPVTVSGNGSYPSGEYTPTAVGTYYWIAEYSGDNENLAVSGECGDANESSVVGKAPSTLNTEQSFYPNDTATLSASAASGTPTGDVTFSLFGNADCSGTALYGPVSDTLDANGEASTDNTSFAVSTSGTLYWKVEYEGDNSHEPVDSCSENTELTINNGGPTTSQ